jgi:hypothetical protein
MHDVLTDWRKGGKARVGSLVVMSGVAQSFESKPVMASMLDGDQSIMHILDPNLIRTVCGVEDGPFRIPFTMPDGSHFCRACLDVIYEDAARAS